MSSHSGVRASSSDREYTRKPILKDAAGYGAWETKMSAILDSEVCWEIVQGTELEPRDIVTMVNEDEAIVDNPADQADVAIRLLEIEDWKKRFKKAASLIT